MMIGRSENFLQLQAHLDKCRQGNLQVVFIAGPPGIGKSTLVEEVQNTATGFFTISYHFFESLCPPYAPLIHALRSLLSSFPQVKNSLSLYQQLGVLLPELHTNPAGTDKATLAAAIREIIEKAARSQPLMLILEDGHWADTATLELIPLLLEGSGSLPIMLVITYRNDSIPREHPLMKVRTHLRRLPFYKEIQLPAFTLPETAQLIATQTGQQPNPDLARLIYNQTQGLPFFVKELTHALQNKGLLIDSADGLMLEENRHIPVPETIRDMVALQLDGLSEKARETLEIAALIGQEFSLEMLSEISGMDQAIDELFGSTLLIEKEGGTGAFSHALVREVIKQDIVWSKRRQLNLQVAAALEKRQAPPEQVGQYWLEAGEKTKAREAFMEASGIYCRMHAHADVARTAHLALDIWPKGYDEPLRLQLLRQFAQCTRYSGQVHHSIKALREMLESPLMKEDYRQQGEVYRSLAISYALQGTWQHYKQCRLQAAEAHEKAGMWAEASQDWHDLANRYIDEMDLAAALDAVKGAIDCAISSTKTDLQAKSLSLKGYILSIQGRSKEGEAIARNAVSLALSHHHSEASAYAYRKLAGVMEYASDYNGSLQAYDTALNYCRHENHEKQAHFCMTCMSWILFRMGDWKRSLEVCKEYMEQPGINDASKGLGYVIIGLIRGLRGETKSAYQYVQEASVLATRADFHLIDPILFWAMTIPYDMENKPDKAYHHFCHILKYWEKNRDVHDILPGLFYAMAFFARHGYLEECNQTIQILSSIANFTGNAEAVAILSFALGEMAALQNKYQEAITHYTHAAQAFTELSVPLELATVWMHTGKAHMAAAENQLAAEAFRQALPLAKSLGVRPMAAAIHDLLEQATEKGTGPISAKTRLPSAGLTGRQLEILQALIDGLSNKEIAARFDLSTRTVDMHVRHIFDRLNCRTRTEAVRIALDKKLLQQVS